MDEVSGVECICVPTVWPHSAGIIHYQQLTSPQKGSIVNPEDISDVTSMMTIDMAESDGPFYDLNHDTESRSRVSTR